MPKNTAGSAAIPECIKPTVLDLFAGAGGLSLGFAQAGYRVVGGIDNSVPAMDTFEANIGDARAMVRDCRLALNCKNAPNWPKFGI